MKTETPLSIIMRNQKPSLLERLGRFIATPFVAIYNSIKSAIGGKQEIPSNFANELVTLNTEKGKFEGGYLYEEVKVGTEAKYQTNPLAKKETTQEQPNGSVDGTRVEHHEGQKAQQNNWITFD